MDPTAVQEVAAYDDAEATELLNLTTEDGSHTLGIEQTRDLINRVLDATQDGLLRRIPPQNRISMNATSLDIGRMTLPSVVIQQGLAGYEAMDPAQYTVPEYDHRTLTLYTWDGHIDIEVYTLSDNVEGPGHEGKVKDAMAMRIGNNLEQTSWLSDTAGATADPAAGECWSTDYDGWRILLADGNPIDHEGGGVGPDLFQDMIETLPVEIQPAAGNPLGFVFYVSKTVFYRWRGYLQGQAVDAGFMQLIENDIPAYCDVPLVPINYIPNTAAGVDSLSDSTSTYSYVALARDEDFFVGFKPEMTVWRAPRPVDGKVIHLHWNGRIGFQMPQPENTVLALNVNPVVAT